jgi:hypothetical protein
MAGHSDNSFTWACLSLLKPCDRPNAAPTRKGLLGPTVGQDEAHTQAEDEYQRFLVCAEVLRTLAAAEPLMIHGSADPMRLVLRTGAEACERLEEMVQTFTKALQRRAALEQLLSHVAEVLGREPLPIDGGSWAVLELTQQVQRALDELEPGYGGRP